MSTTIEPEKPESTTSKSEKIEPTITNSENLEPTTSMPESLKPTTKPEKLESTTSITEKIVSTTTKPEIPESITSKPEKIEPTTSNSGSIKPTTSKPEKIEPTTTEPEKPESTTPIPEKLEPTTNEPEKMELTTSKPESLKPTTEQEKIEPTTSKPESLKPTTKPEKIETTTSKPVKPESTTSEVKTNEHSIYSTSVNNPKTEAILTTISNHINLTSIASTEARNNIKTTIVENKIETTTGITDYAPVNAIVVALSHFLKYNSYCSFYIHFLSINGFIFAPSLIMLVNLIRNNTNLRILENREANCDKVDDDTIKAAYLCKVVGDVSTATSIKIENEYNFAGQNVTVIGVSPIAHTLMENVQNANGDYDELLNSKIYVLDHSYITSYNKNKTFDITGIIDDQTEPLEKNDLILKVNTKKANEITESDLNCTIININGSYYSLNCQGESNILYDLQSSISSIDNDFLVVNFDQNTTSELIFSNSYRFYNNNSGSLSAGAIVAIVLAILIASASVIILALVFRRRKKQKKEKTVESTIVDLKSSNL